MKTSTHSLAVTAAIAASAVSFSAKAAAAPQAPCGSLATLARGLPSEAWKQGVEKAMAPALSIDKERNPDAYKNAGDPFERSLTRLPWVREAVSNEAGNWSEFVSRLPGQDIYMVSTYQGTLHCQSAVFIRARKGTKPRRVSNPAVFDKGEGPCWTQSGKLGTVLGQPAFIQGGADNDHTFDASYTVVPWTGGGWAKDCKLSLRFRTGFEVTDRHCGDAEICRAAGGIAAEFGRAYNDYRRTSDAGKASAFIFGPPQKAQEAQQQLIEGRSFASDVPRFPRLGDESKTPYGGSFSYVGFQYTPVLLVGRWYVAAIGHEGVGWRESDRTLIAIYDEKDGMLTPKASFEVQAVNPGLIDVKADAGS